MGLVKYESSVSPREYDGDKHDVDMVVKCDKMCMFDVSLWKEHYYITQLRIVAVCAAHLLFGLGLGSVLGYLYFHG